MIPPCSSRILSSFHTAHSSPLNVAGHLFFNDQLHNVLFEVLFIAHQVCLVIEKILTITFVLKNTHYSFVRLQDDILVW